jgi:hypothetical protein
MEDPAHDFEAAIDRGCACTTGKASLHEALQRLIVHLLRFEIAGVTLQQHNVPFDDIDAAYTARLFNVTSGAIGEGSARVCLSRDVAFHASHLCAESLLGLLLCYRADAQANPNAEIALVYESLTIGENGDTRRAGRGHERLLKCGGAFSKAAVDQANGRPTD